ncbi:hypothetical protein [Rossellomorea aquimaris]|uniref:Uncharacterized protein n=1 Tax=Rossellomorea aquimaris TaxID=189382 RepID=A0A366EKN0_9BACI|nr:hypothetical protein [Rossellomorea aquimaris]RBP02516.1 hypothetical protein DET59_11479 [Rossellomorea aquimaris]
MRKILKMLGTVFFIAMLFTGNAAFASSGSSVETDVIDGQSVELGEQVKVTATEAQEKVSIDKAIGPDAAVEPDCIACVNFSRHATKISSYGEVYKFVKYLTSTWQGADNYRWSSTTTTSLTVSGSADATIKDTIKVQLGLSGSYSKSYSVTISIPADPSRDNRLALYGDFNKYYVKYQEKMGGAVVHTSYHYAYEPTRDQYLRVVYR